MGIIEKITRDISNIPGFSTKKKIIVFESDDWGSIRVPNKKAAKYLFENGIFTENSDEARYLLNDTLETYDDLERLFDVLSNVNQRTVNTPKFTALSIVANPDYEKIRVNKFKTYFFESVFDSWNRFGSAVEIKNIIRQGIDAKLFFPEFHGREHLNVSSWMRALNSGNKDTLTAFDISVYGIKPRQYESNIKFQAAFDIYDPEELKYLAEVIESGLMLFRNVYGFGAKYFVPTNGPFNNSLENTLGKAGIEFIGASKIQHEPIGYSKFRKRFHYLGQRNRINQIYLTRNCFFEPSSKLKNDWINSCLAEMASAFRWGKPAVISTHRVNYMGSNNVENRDNGLKQLEKLLKAINSNWPDAVYMSSIELGSLIRDRKK